MVRSRRLRLAWSAVVIVGFTCASAAAGQSRAGRIDKIAPTAARLGEHVTITGNGFGGPNVKVTVGGVDAKVVSARGNRVTFVVPDGLSGGAAVVTATNPGGHTGAIGLDVKLPEILSRDDAHAASVVISPQGGVVAATGPDGAIYTLAVPPRALADDTRITLTPVASIANLPFSNGLVAAVTLEPEGLRFLGPVDLTIELPGPPQISPVIGFMFGSDASDFHPFPVLLEGSLLTFSLTHFTTVGAGGGSPLQQPLPCTSRQSAEQTIAPLVPGMGDPAVMALIFSCFRQWFNAAVSPALETARTDASSFEPAAAEFVDWAAAVSVFTLDDWNIFEGTGPFGSEGVLGMGLVQEGARNAVAQANQNCLANKSQFISHVTRVIHVGSIMHSLTDEDEHEFSLGNLLRDLCVRVRIHGALLFPTTLAEDQPATLSIQAGLEFRDGTRTTDQQMAIQLNVTGGTADQPGGPTGPGGTFNASVTPLAGSPEVRVEVFASYPLIPVLPEDTRTLISQVQSTCPAPVAPLAVFGATAFAPQTAALTCVQVEVSPPTATIRAGSTVQFSATVTGASNTAVTWTLPGGGGAIDPVLGTFTAGPIAGTFPVRATSVENSGAFDEATVTVTNAGRVLTGLVTVHETHVDTGGGGFSPQNTVLDLSAQLAVEVSPANALSVVAATGSFSIITDTVHPNCTANSTFTGTVVGGTMGNPSVGPARFAVTGTETVSGSCFVEPGSLDRSSVISVLFTVVAPTGTITALDFNRTFTVVQRNGAVTITHVATGRLVQGP